jgi:hypothetical protein
MPFTTRDSFKTYAGITDSALDAVIDLLIPQVDKLFKRFTQQNLEQGTYIEFYGGTNSMFFRLRQRPVASIINLWLDPTGYFGIRAGSFAAPTLLVPGEDYVLVPDQPDGSSRAGKVARINEVWPGVRFRPHGLIGTKPVKGRGNIKVEYLAGYAEVPEDLTLAANMTIAHIRQSRKHGALVQSESFEDYEYELAMPGNFDFRDIPPNAKSILAAYRPLVA